MKILIVDGDHLLLETMREICELEGFQTVTLLSYDLALIEMEKGFLPLMIFCDIFPPKNGGHHFLAKMKGRKEWNSIPFVLMSTMRGKKNKDAVELIKPFSIDELTSYLDLVKPF